MKGFTLVELLIAIALMATLLTVGVPGFRDLVASNQRRAISFDLYSDLQLARSEAISRNQRISVCKSTDGLQCLDAAEGGWKDGWIVYANPGGLDDPADVADVLAVHDPIQDYRFSLIPQDPTSAVRFDFKPNGRSQQAGGLDLCHDSGTVQGRRIRLLATGTVLITQGGCS